MEKQLKEWVHSLESFEGKATKLKNKVTGWINSKIKHIKSKENKDNNENHKENKDNNENHSENIESVQKTKEELEQEAKIVEIAEQSIQGIYEQEKSEQLFLKSNYNMLIYLKILNKNRSKLIDLNEAQFTAIKTIITFFLSKLSIEIPSPDQENELFYEIMEYIIILSQTFYHIEKTTNKRVIMQDELQDEKIWQNKDLWLFLIYRHVDCEFTRQKISSITNIQEKETKAKAIYTSTVTTYEFNMKSSGLHKDTITEIKGLCKEKYPFRVDITHLWK